MSDSSEKGNGCSCTGDGQRAERDPAYRRALWLVVLLNLGFGAIEVVGGFFARSEALKADSLDFFGDGFITLLGLIALSWSKARRSQVALLQGVFLACIGLTVLLTAIWRAAYMIPPEAGLMGGLAIAALGINVTSALVLSKFHDGDAQTKAVWLFSRNDALANLAVVAAAGLVFWLNSAWLDLVVAGVLAIIFLHSAYEILASALKEMKLGGVG
jgi:Co/Zn/Cd efflux system component